MGMTCQGAINYFREYIKFCERGSVGLPSKEPYMIAIHALQKQVPKKPAKVNHTGIRYTDTYRCPSCGGSFTGTGIADYCYHCGQALDWEDHP